MLKLITKHVNNKKQNIAIILIDYPDITILTVTLIVFMSQQLRYIHCIIGKNLTRTTSNSNKRSTGFFLGIPSKTRQYYIYWLTSTSHT